MWPTGAGKVRSPISLPIARERCCQLVRVADDGYLSKPHPLPRGSEPLLNGPTNKLTRKLSVTLRSGLVEFAQGKEADVRKVPLDEFDEFTMTSLTQEVLAAF